MVKRGLVSVVIVTHNGKKHVGECIDSVTNSTFKKIELVIVDNGSNDDSYQFLKDKYRKRVKIRIFRINENLFFTGGSNFGAVKATGEKLIFLNDDTIVEPDFIKTMVRFTGKKNKYLVQPKVVRYRDGKIDNAGGYYNYLGMGVGRGHGEIDRGQYNTPRRLSYVVGTVFMIDANFFWEIGGFDQWFKYHYEDVDLSLSAVKKGGECWYCPEAIVYHKGSLTIKRIKTDELKLNIRKNRLMVILKNFQGVEKIFRLGLALSHSLTGMGLVFNKCVQNYVDRQRLSEISRLTKPIKKNLLDVGCGDGNFVLLARKNGLDAWGIDKELTTANKYLSTENLEKFKTEKKYDLMTMFHVLEHVKNPLKSLSKLTSYLKKGGTIVIEVPLVENLSQKFLGNEYFAYFDKTHLNLWGKEKWLQLIEQAGLICIKQGQTKYEFPLAVINGGFRKGIFWGVVGLIIFFPLKLLTLLGFNEEIVRLYCIKTSKNE